MTVPVTPRLKIAAYVYPEVLKTPTGVSMLTLNMLRLLGGNPEVELRLLASRDELESNGELPPALGFSGIPVTALPWSRVTREGLWLAANVPAIDRYVSPETWIYCSRETFIPARRCKRIVTVHHLEPIIASPDFSRPWLAIRSREFRIRRATQTADVIVAQSTFTKTQVAERYGVSPERIHVVGSGVADELLATGASSWRPAPNGLEPYVICAGAFHLRKGTDYLLRMARELARRGSPLKIVCPYGSRGAAALVEDARKLPSIVMLDYMPREDLLAAIRNAVCMVIPSRLEGFGLTAIEAMALATPVVASDNSALPETLGGAGILVDPTNATALADAVEQVFQSPAVRSRMVAAGLQRAENFTWAKCMQRLLAPLRDSANRDGTARRTEES